MNRYANIFAVSPPKVLTSFCSTYLRFVYFTSNVCLWFVLVCLFCFVWQFARTNFLKHQYAKLFRLALLSKSSGPLREELAKSPAKLIALFHGKVYCCALFSVNSEQFSAQTTQTTTTEFQMQALELVRLLVKLIPDWLPKNRAVLDCLVDMWKSPQVTLCVFCPQ